MEYTLNQSTMDELAAFCVKLNSDFPEEVEFIRNELGDLEGSSFMATLGMYFFFIQKKSKIKNVRFKEFIEFLKTTLRQEIPDVPQAAPQS